MYLQSGALMFPSGQLSERMSQICEVYCTHCHESLGTMDMLAIVDAVHVKGSILCPDCRAGCCVHCGEPGLRRNEAGVCLFCFIEAGVWGGFGEWSPACPTNQKSTEKSVISEKPVLEKCEICSEEKPWGEIRLIAQMSLGQEDMSVCETCYLSFSRLESTGHRVCDCCGRIGAYYQVNSYENPDTGRLAAWLCADCYQFTGGKDVE